MLRDDLNGFYRPSRIALISLATSSFVLPSSKLSVKYRPNGAPGVFSRFDVVLLPSAARRTLEILPYRSLESRFLRSEFRVGVNASH